MDSSSSKEYDYFEVPIVWLLHPDSYVVRFYHLLGFRSKYLKVQVTSTGKLRVVGERWRNGKWQRFHKEIDIPTDADTDTISAKLEEGILDVKLPKKPSAAVDPPTVRQNAPESRSRRPQKPTENPMADPQTVRQNAPQSRNEKAQAQAQAQARASGKQIPPAQKAVEKTEKQTEEEEKGKAHTTLKEALKKTREEENGSKMEEEEDGVAERRRRRRRKLRRMSEEMEEEESGRLMRREGYKKVIDGMVKELRTNMVTLVLGVAVFVIVYFNVAKNGHHVD